ncbi:MAG: phosphoethanolamine transferase [Bacteroidaceae bacterium]|nr:phosphoethanolamine transferase [Bacteroidaceae bacterium]
MKFTPPHCGFKWFIINAISFLSKPVTCQPAFFILLFLLLGFPDIYSILIVYSLLPLFKTSFAFLSCYILALPVVFLTERPRKFYKTALLVFAGFFFFVDIYLLLLYNETLATITKDALAAVLATNPGEAVEYIYTYFTIDKLLIISVIFSAVFVLSNYLRKIRFKWNGFARCTVVILLLFSVSKLLCDIEKVKDFNLCYLITKECPNLREYRQNPSIVNGSERVENIVLLIGESFSKFNSSLYGYEKETNPLLGNLKSDSALFIYENVTSACVTTIPSIKSIMMAYTDNMSDSIEWCRCLTLIEVMQKSGYKIHWFSNQSKTGLFDNEVGRFADLCDEQFFVGNKHSGMNRDNKDEELIPLFEGCLSDSTQSKFIVVQMMGSHTAFNMRYPESFGVFDNEDYNITHPELSRENKQLLAEYDNSVLYNDYVVNELLQRFVNEDAIVFYFSDHGIDVFKSSNDYIGHAKADNTISVNAAMQIPFMVYTSPLFREKHPELQQRIENAVSRPYRTDSIMYTIMDVAGVESVNSVSYKQKSLFK